MNTGGEPRSLKEKCIVVVDDEAQDLESMIQAFEFFGANVLIAENTSIAIEILKTKKVDVLLSSMQMMGENYSFLRNIQQASRLKPLVFLYSAVGSHSLETLQNLGAIEVFRKSTPHDQMIQAVRDALAAAPAPSSSTSVNLERVSFLVVQEAISEIEIVSNLLALEFPNANIMGALTPKSGLQKLSRQKFDLVIADMNLGKVSGINFIRAVSSDQSLGSNLKFVLTSDGPPPAELHQLPGRVAFCPKPLDQDSFLDVVKSLVIIRMEEGAPAAAYKIDVEFINPFIESTLKVFDSIAGIKPVKELIFVRSQDQASGDISAVIEMNSERFLGSMAISFEETCFLPIASLMLGKTYISISDEIKNTAGEICGQIFNHAKKSLNQKGHSILPATPKILIGKSHSIKHSAKGICIGIRFRTETGVFTIEAVLQPH